MFVCPTLRAATIQVRGLNDIDIFKENIHSPTQFNSFLNPQDQHGLCQFSESEPLSDLFWDFIFPNVFILKPTW